MPDDISIPFASGRAPFTQSYSTRRSGLDAGAKRLMLAAVALGLILLAGMGVWALMSRRPASIPVIEADARPLRVKPDNPGGMQVAGADEQVMGGSGSGGADAMAPAAEAPAPQALRAQMGQPGTPEPGPAASSLPDTPAVPARAPARPAAPARAAGGTLVQLAAVDNEHAAQAEWQRLAKRMPDLLGGRRAVVQRAERDGHTVWRVRTGGFADIAEATGFCTRVRAKGAACSLASF